MKKTHFLLLLLLAAVLPILFGCSTIVNHGRPSGVEVRSDPIGADIFLDGKPTGSRTPARIEIEGGSGEHVLRIEKAGYGTFERTVSKGMDPWVWGNAPFALFPIAAAAGFGVDAWCGQWYRVDPSEVDAKLSGAIPAAPAVEVPPAPRPAAAMAPPEPLPAAAKAPPEPAPAEAPDEMDELLKQVLDNN